MGPGPPAQLRTRPGRRRSENSLLQQHTPSLRARAKQSSATRAAFRLRASALRRTRSSLTLLAITVKTYVLVLAARFARALHRPSPSPKCRGRREGRVAAAPGAAAQREFARAR